MNVCAYCRVSTDKDDQANSFENQQQYFEKHISQHPEWHLTKIYADEGVTGTNTKKRKSFNEMIADAREGKIDLILTKEVTRFARNTVDTLKYTRELKDIDVRVIFLIDSIDTFDPDGEFRLTIMASLAQEESRKTSERVKWGISQQMKKGFVYSPSLLGYDVQKGVISINKPEAEIVQRIFHDFAYENKTAHRIARELTEQGVMPVKRMKSWSSTTILRILRNEKYVGDLIQRKTYVKNFLDHKCVKNTDLDTMYFAYDHHEPIIDRETWDIVQNRLQTLSSSQENQVYQQSNRNRFKASNKYWCSGKIKCGLCGTNFSITSKKLSDGTTFKAWKCIKRMKFGQQKIDGIGNLVGCNNNQINIKALEQCVEYAYDALTQNCHFVLDNFKNELRLSDVFSGKNEYDISELESQKKQIILKKQKVIEMFVDGLITKEELEGMKNKYSEKEISINKTIEEMKAMNVEVVTLDDRIKNIKSRIDEIIKSKEYKNGFLYGKLVDHIIAYPNKLEIFFKKIPFPIIVSYQTKGRGDNYTAICELCEREFVNN